MTTLEKATIWKMNQWILGHFFDKTMWQSTKWPDPLRLDGRCAPFFSGQGETLGWLDHLGKILTARTCNQKPLKGSLGFHF